MFDQDLYRREMDAMLQAAKAGLVAEYADLVVYTISIWTDPGAGVSAISFDTFENSEKAIKQLAEWAKPHYEQAVVEGDLDQAKLFEALVGKRNDNPAAFYLRAYRQTRHQSFSWNGQTEGGDDGWDLLEPALNDVGAQAAMFFKDISLHPEAVLGVNSRRDWFDTTWSLGFSENSN